MQEVAQDSNVTGMFGHSRDSEENTPRRILIATHQVVVCEGLKRIVSEEVCDARFGEAIDSTQLLDEVARFHWHMVILDAELQGCACITLVRELKSRRAGMIVVVLGAPSNPGLARDLVVAGASGYVNREGSLADLKRALQTVFSGGNYLDELCLDGCATALSRPERLVREMLSLRERQVMFMIASGKTSKEIAWDLSLSIKTISTYRARVLKKTKMRSNAEIIRYAIQNNLEGLAEDSSGTAQASGVSSI